MRRYGNVWVIFSKAARIRLTRRTSFYSLLVLAYLFASLSMDRTDRKILSILQEDATMPVADIARKVGLSTTPCWRRIQKLEEDKVIERRVAVLNPGKVNVGVTVFVSIRTDKHNAEWLKRFSEVISKMPEVVGFYRMSGQIDYLLKVVVPDIAAYDAVYKRLVSDIEIEDVSSTFAMERIKDTMTLPLDYMMLDKA